MMPRQSENRYTLAVLALLLAASAVSVLLVVVRMRHTESVQYDFLLWNLLLAWIPLGIAALVSVLSRKRGPAAYIALAVAVVPWLLFFPNAPYILTDFQHLTSTPVIVPTWYDVILLIWFAWTGLLLGVTALYFMQSVVTRILGVVAGWVFALLAIALAGLGVFMGRFLGWNSWDIMHRPGTMISEIWSRVSHPLDNPHMVGFTGMFALFFLFVYLTIYALGRLTYERGQRSAPPPE